MCYDVRAMCCRRRLFEISIKNSGTDGLRSRNFCPAEQTWPSKTSGKAPDVSTVPTASFRNGHLKRKPTTDADSSHSEDHLHCFNPNVTRASSSRSTATVPNAKRPRTNNNPADIYQQFSNLTILQNCKALPFVIALAAILMELCDENDPQMLCNVLEIANQILKLKKGGNITLGHCA